MDCCICKSQLLSRTEKDKGYCHKCSSDSNMIEKLLVEILRRI